MNVHQLVPETDAAGTVTTHDLTSALGTTDVALNCYSIPADEGLPGGLHTHMDQEEVFVVLEGRASFETLDGDVNVEAGEAIRFAPGEFQSGRNGGNSDLRILAIGAPKRTEDVRIPAVCPACDHDNLRLDFGGETLTFRCPHCGSDHIPADCPNCGHTDLEVGLAEGSETAVVCQQCGARFDRPPLE